jgi:hypothetical protein
MEYQDSNVLMRKRLPAAGENTPPSNPTTRL